MQTNEKSPPALAARTPEATSFVVVAVVAVLIFLALI